MLRTRAKARSALPTNTPAMMNGMPRPSEYTNRRNAPATGSLPEAARARIDASTGPTHGVHPRANAIPLSPRRPVRGAPAPEAAGYPAA